MIYFVFITFFSLLLIGALGHIFYSVRAFNSLYDGSIVYQKKSNINDSDPNEYYRARITQDKEGNKCIDNNPFTCWDLIKGDIITEELYYTIFD